MATRGHNRWRYQNWGNPCASRPKRTHRWADPGDDDDGVSRGVLVEWYPALELLDDVFDSHNYEVDSAGSYNCRLITNGTVYSPHAWPLAVDVNPRQNPYTRRGLITDMDLRMVEDAYKIITADTHQRIWKWGGDWDGDWDFDEHTIWDAMHWEIIATPTELAQGIVYDGNLIVPEVTRHMFCAYGNENDNVLAMQLGLIRLGYDISFKKSDGSTHPGDDGDFGNATLGDASIAGKGLARFQFDKGISEVDVNGRAKYGPRSFDALYATGAGAKGDKGEPGEDGKDGVDGRTPTTLIVTEWETP